MEHTNDTVSLEKISNLLLDKKKENLKYNKQEIPETLKYNSDDEDSFISKENIEKNEIINNNLSKINDIDMKPKEENLNENKMNKSKPEEKNSYELLILKKMDIYNDEDQINQKGEIKKVETEKEKNEEIKENEFNTIENKINENDIDKYSSKTFSKKIENDDSNSNEKKNVLKLLSLIKNKMNEKEKLDKEKESIKEEMFKRAKSQEGDKIKKNEDGNQSPKHAHNQIKQVIYNRKRKTLNNHKSVNIKSYSNKFNSIEREDGSEKNIRINKVYKHHFPNKSMDINSEKDISNKNKKINLQKKLYNVFLFLL